MKCPTSWCVHSAGHTVPCARKPRDPSPPNLFEQPVDANPLFPGAPSNGTDTSDQAAASIEPVRGHLQHRVLTVIVQHGPITCDAIEHLTGGAHQSISARVRELSVAGLIRVDGRADTRSGRAARTYTATSTGHRAARSLP